MDWDENRAVATAVAKEVSEKDRDTRGVDLFQVFQRRLCYARLRA